jgi:hypothetical protein
MLQFAAQKKIKVRKNKILKIHFLRVGRFTSLCSLKRKKKQFTFAFIQLHLKLVPISFDLKSSTSLTKFHLKNLYTQSCHFINIIIGFELKMRLIQ